MCLDLFGNSFSSPNEYKVIWSVARLNSIEQKHTLTSQDGMLPNKTENQLGR